MFTDNYQPFGAYELYKAWKKAGVAQPFSINDLFPPTPLTTSEKVGDPGDVLGGRQAGEGRDHMIPLKFVT